MFKNFKDLFDHVVRELDPNTQDAPDPQALQLATAVLLVEVMRADPDQDARETDAVLQALQRKFGLPAEAVAALLERATDTSRTSNDYYQFTSVLNEQLSHPQKIAVVEAMWTVAYANDHLDVHENAVIYKVAGLLYVTHGEYIAAKMRAKEAVAGTTD
ncbi:MAG: TerB family tellurite resistance protein [Hydrogenophaga sp.]|uniref:tellurite resistance TerB family protein n=1 Tax=Hydrogenophaga sp. TaxID=1904254 RepID=UPI001D1E6948|nr:TerB family tellurite resistance protein [Hydrogenophaga sp.]MBX3611925.1 TerB family tellurite resistance protein [Hydrogenophaga sp.]